VTLSFRVTALLKAWLSYQADLTGKSLGQEIAGRLEASQDFEAAFGGPRAAAFFRGMANSVSAAFGDDDWFGNPTRFSLVCDHLIGYMEAFKSDLSRAAAPRFLIDAAIDEFMETRDPQWLDMARNALGRHAEVSPKYCTEMLALLAAAEAKAAEWTDGDVKSTPSPPLAEKAEDAEG